MILKSHGDAEATQQVVVDQPEELARQTLLAALDEEEGLDTCLGHARCEGPDAFCRYGNGIRSARRPLAVRPSSLGHGAFAMFWPGRAWSKKISRKYRRARETIDESLLKLLVEGPATRLEPAFSATSAVVVGRVWLSRSTLSRLAGGEEKCSPGLAGKPDRGLAGCPLPLGAHFAGERLGPLPDVLYTTFRKLTSGAAPC